MLGSGTSVDPYIIENFTDLDLLGSGSYTLNKYYELGANIDASPTADPGYNSGAGWLPRGNFTGSFDGKGYSISSLYINRPSTSIVGFFSNCGGVVKNLTLASCDITGAVRTGGICGYANTNLVIENCHVTGSVVGTNQVGGIIGETYQWGAVLVDILSCSFDGDVTGTTDVGGICGRFIPSHVDSVIDDCTALGTINLPSGNHVGGIAGYFRRNISNCTIDSGLTFNVHSSATDVGGIIGYSDNVLSTIVGCDFSSSVTGNIHVGGIIGRSVSQSKYSYIEDCESTGSVNGVSDVGGIAGRWVEPYTHGYIKDCRVGCSVYGSSDSVGGCVGYGLGNINNITQLEGLSVTGESTTNYIGGIIGQIYGNAYIHHCYLKLDITGNDYVGGIVGGTRSYGSWLFMFEMLSYNGSITGNDYLGGICGFARQIASGNYVKKCYSIGSVTGNDYVGGLIGYPGTLIENSYSLSDVEGDQYVGGLVGYANNTTLTNCYSAGAVTGVTDVGGLAGYETGSTANDCFWDIQTTGQTSGVLGTGKNTSEMKTESTYTNWDFVSVWGIGGINNGYPYLKDFPTAIIVNIVNSLDVGFDFGCGTT